MTKKKMNELLIEALNNRYSPYDSQTVQSFKMKKEMMLNGETWYFIDAVIKTTKTFGKHKLDPVIGQDKRTYIYNKNRNELMAANWDVIYKF